MLLSISAAAVLELLPGPALDGLQAEAGDEAAWDLTELYLDDSHWEQARQTAIAAIPSLAIQKGTLGYGGAALQQAYTAASNLSREVDRLGAYAQLKARADLREPRYQEMQQLAAALSSQLQAALAWLKPETLSLGEPSIKAYLNACPGLEPFRFQLTGILRQATHTLPEGQESLLANATPLMEAPFAIEQELISSDMPHPEAVLSGGERVRADDQGFAAHVGRASRPDRKILYDAYYGGYARFQNSLGATLSASITGDIIRARARHFQSTLEAALYEPKYSAKGLYHTHRAGTSGLARVTELLRTAAPQSKTRAG